MRWHAARRPQADEALQVYHDMRARGIERTGITYSSLLQACEKAGRWQLALDLFQEMHRDGIKPSAAVYNALIAVCGQGARPACPYPTPGYPHPILTWRMRLPLCLGWQSVSWWAGPWERWLSYVLGGT